MPAPISPILPVPRPDPIRPDSAVSTSGDFRSVFESAVQRVEQSQQNAAGAVDRFLSGEGEEVHEAALSAERAELTFDLFVQARNKVVSAYQEIMRMQM
jgi:flagellar hook-basal body complex protein FliE